MEIVNVQKSDKNQIYKLALEENKILQKYSSHPIYKVKLTRELFEKMFRNNLKRNNPFFGIKENDKIIAIISGYIKSAPKGDVGYIDNMFVSKSYLKKGYATTLRNEFYKWLKSKKIKYCQLDVLSKIPQNISTKNGDFLSMNYK